MPSEHKLIALPAGAPPEFEETAGRDGPAGWRYLPEAALVAAFGFVAFAVLLSIFLAAKIVSFVVLGTVGFVLCFTLSGNQRLFCLWGLVLTAPLSLVKNFLITPHMGGASAITIDFDDVFIALLLAFMVRDFVTGRRKYLRVSPLAYWWGGLIVLGMANIVLGPFRHLALLEVVRMIKCLVLFIVVVNELVRVRQFMHFVAALVAGIALEASLAIVQFTFKANLGLQFLGEPPTDTVKWADKSVYLGHGDDIYRAGGLMSHANILAGYLAILLPICLALLFCRISVPLKLLVSAITMLGLGALIITLSRSGWSSFGAAFVILMLVVHIHRNFRRRHFKTRFAILFVTLVGLAMASGAIIKRVTESDPGAFNFRLEMMDAAWAIVADKPVFGLGLNAFVPLMPPYTKYHGPIGVTDRYGKDWPVVHNAYLITWTEQGTVGFICLVGLYLWTLKMGVQTARYMIDDRIFMISAGACCGIIANMVDGFASFLIDESAGERVLFLVLGLIVAANYWTMANRHSAVRAVARAPEPQGIAVAA